jgi:uncharacterized membrane protein
MKRPTGVTIIAVLAAIGGVFGLLAALVLLAGGTVGGAAGLGGFLFVAGLLVLAYAVLSLVIAYGFWTLQPWAWPLGIGVQVLGIVQALLQFMNDPNQLFNMVVSIAIAAVIIWYLYQPHVRAAFRRA